MPFPNNNNKRKTRRMKRQIKSEAELVNALKKGVTVEFMTKYGARHKPSTMISAIELFKNHSFRYSDPVEVVELWGNGRVFYNLELLKGNEYTTHKLTKIIQNGKTIWTEETEL